MPNYFTKTEIDVRLSILTVAIVKIVKNAAINALFEWKQLPISLLHRNQCSDVWKGLCISSWVVRLCFV